MTPRAEMEDDMTARPHGATATTSAVSQDATATTSAAWQRLTKGLAAWENELGDRRAERDLLQEQKKQEEEDRRKADEERTLAEMAELFLRTEIRERRRKTTADIADMGTAALKHVYGGDYALRFAEAGDADASAGGKAANDKSASLKMEIEIVSLLDGEELTTGLLGERGGGVVEVVAFALRMAALGWRRYEGPLILDEAYKSMSADEKITRVAEFLAHVTEQTGRQVVFATHKADMFGPVAGNVLRVTQTDGVASVERLTGYELAALSSQDADDPEP